MPQPLDLAAWPFTALRLTHRDVVLRPVAEADLPHLVAIEPDDYEHDPAAELLPGLTLRENRARLLCQSYWRSRGTWSPNSWVLDFAVEHVGRVVGVQSLEADNYPTLRTVDSGSWLEPPARGRGIGKAMRTAVLSLAFDHLGALAAVTSARHDNHPSLGVSRHLGYRPNGTTLNASPTGLVELTHLRLTRPHWTPRTHTVHITGLTPCLPWFGDIYPTAYPGS